MSNAAAGKRVSVAGHCGMVGSAFLGRLASGTCEFVTVGREALELTPQDKVQPWLARERPRAVFLPAGRVGGILINEAQPLGGSGGLRGPDRA